MSDSNSKNNNLKGFKNSWMDMRGCVWVGGKFLKPWQVTHKNYWVNFYASHIQHFTSDSNSKIDNLQGFENSWKEIWKFIKPWQVTHKIIEWIFIQVTFNILWVTLTQKIITWRLSKIHEWIWGDVYEWGKVLKPWQVTHKIIEWIFIQVTFNILRVTLTHRVSNIHKWIWGDLYESGKVFLNHDKWHIKLLSEFFRQFTFNILWVTLTQKIITRRVSNIHKWIWWDIYEWGKVS